MSGPTVSVVVPMLDEAGWIERCLAGFAAQTWPADQLEVVVADGGSTDGSRQTVEALCEEHPWLRLVDNPRRHVTGGCNEGLAAAKGDIVAFFSSHGEPEPGYVEAIATVLEETGATGVGGVYVHEGVDPRSQAIGLAMSSPFGMASPHRFAAAQAEVDTISHPAYRIEAVRAVGGFDETFERNEDYELNLRLREAGGRLVFDPRIRSVYRPRGDLSRLARQFWGYGRWKGEVVRHHPQATRPRHLVPPAAVAGLLLGPLAARTRVGRRACAAAGLGYATLVAVGVARTRPRAHGADPLVTAAAFPVMHLSWGAGLLLSLVRRPPRTRG